MGKFIKYGRIVVVLQGRFAGKKGVVIKATEEGNKERKFGHALVAGVERAPRRVTKAMSKKKIQKRTRVKPFVKYLNLNHLLPTRYQVGTELDLKAVVGEERLGGADKRKELKKELKGIFEDKYRTLPAAKGGNDKSSHLRFLLKKLRF
jgi:large subunit ribosomal protein L27e